MVVVRMSSSILHSWMCRVRCEIFRLVRTHRLPLVCGVCRV